MGGTSGLGGMHTTQVINKLHSGLQPSRVESSCAFLFNCLVCLFYIFCLAPSFPPLSRFHTISHPLDLLVRIAIPSHPNSLIHSHSHRSFFQLDTLPQPTIPLSSKKRQSSLITLSPLGVCFATILNPSSTIVSCSPPPLVSIQNSHSFVPSSNSTFLLFCVRLFHWTLSFFLESKVFVFIAQASCRVLNTTNFYLLVVLLAKDHEKEQGIC